MGKGEQASGKDYYGSLAGVVCAGPVDELVAFILDGKTLWPTDRTWADDIIDIPAISIARNGNNKGYITFAVPHKLHNGQFFVSSGFDAPPDGDSFNYAVKKMVTNNNDDRIQFVNAGSEFGSEDGLAVTSGTITKVVAYVVGDLVRYGGGIWECIQAHDGYPVNAPPNVTYWQPYSVHRTLTGNPFPFTVPGYGQAYFYWGTDDQELREGSFLLENDHPPYRHQAFIELEDFLFGTERQGAPNIEVIVRRRPNQTVIVGPSAELDDDSQANPLACSAELLTNGIFGVGQPVALLAESFQTVAEELAEDSGNTYVSPVMDTQDSFRSFISRLLAYYDGWHRFNSQGKIDAGRFLHNEAPPAFTDANTIDFHDCVDEIEIDSGGWAETFNETSVKFADRARAFKDGGRLYTSGYNRQVVGEPRREMIDRPWITREEQADQHAAEYGKIHAQPFFSGSLKVRAEKVTAIQVGSIFRLTHDAVEMSVVCRCLEKTLAAPPAGLATIRFESERGVAPIPYSPTAAAAGGTGLPHPERIDYYQLVQPPPSMAGSEDFRLMVLAARKSKLSLGLRPWLNVDDEALFYQLGEQAGWAVKFELAQDYPTRNSSFPNERSRGANVATISMPGHGYATGMRVSIGGNDDDTFDTDDAEITVIDVDTFTYANVGANVATTDASMATVTPLPDDESETLQLDPAEFTVQADLDKIGVTQTEDAINDNALLVWAFDGAGDFEIMTVKSIRIEDGIYKLKVRRSRYGTAELNLDELDIAWIVFRSDLIVYQHTLFGIYAQDSESATFRLQSFNANEEADLTDEDVCPDILFDFADPYKPVVEFTLTQADTGSGFVDIADFTTIFSPDDQFKLGFSITDADGDLSEAKLVARLGSLEHTLWSQSFSPSAFQSKQAVFSLDEGEWRIFVVARDLAGRVVEHELTAVGGGSPERLCVQAGGGGAQVQVPVANQPSNGYPIHTLTITLTCSTPGATIHYQKVSFGAPLGAWLTYTGPFSITIGTISVYAYAEDGVLTDSNVVRYDYWYESQSNN